MARDDAPEVIGAAWIAALSHHLEQPAGTEPGILLELLHQERDERVGHRRARHDRLQLHPRLPQNSLHRRVVQPELRSDRANPPFLRVVEAQHLGLCFLRDHADPRSARRRRARKPRSSPGDTAPWRRRPSCPRRQRCPAKRAATLVANQYIFSVLSAGIGLRHDRVNARCRGLRHRLMRHFLRREVGMPVAIASLPCGVQPPSTPARLGTQRPLAEQNRGAAPPSTADRIAASDHIARTAAAAHDIAHKRRPESSPIALGSDRRFLDTELTV